MSLNYLMMFTYKDPESGSESNQNALEVMVVTLKNLLDVRLIAFMLILSGFWLMMYQLWDLHPNFITDWVDTSVFADLVPNAFLNTKTDRPPQVAQENVLNLNAAMIVLLVIPLSIAVKKLRTLTAMLGGMIVATVGILAAGLTNSGWMLLFGIVLFSLGEMLTGPKKNEYLGLIAPPGKKALYLGYVNIPVGIGGFIGSLMSGYLYGNFGEKAVLAQRYLAEKTDYLKSHGKAPWNGDIANLGDTLGVSRAESYDALKVYLKQDGTTVTQLLWDTYQPYQIWYYFAAVGVVSVIALVIYNHMAKQWKDMNV